MSPHRTIFIIRIIFIIFITLLFFVVLLRMHTHMQEPYQSLTDCDAQGYPHDFCLQVPIQAYTGPMPTKKVVYTAASC